MISVEAAVAGIRDPISAELIRDLRSRALLLLDRADSIAPRVDGLPWSDRLGQGARDKLRADWLAVVPRDRLAVDLRALVVRTIGEVNGAADAAGLARDAQIDAILDYLTGRDLPGNVLAAGGAVADAVADAARAAGGALKVSGVVVGGLVVGLLALYVVTR